MTVLASIGQAADGRWDALIDGIAVSFGEGGLDQLGTLCARYGGKRSLLVTDPGVRGAGHIRAATRALTETGVAVDVFDRLATNPTTEHVRDGVEAAKRHEADCLIAVGGGSAMDCAKGINFIISNGGEMRDYWGSGMATQPMLPSIGVPTTAGTGSDAQSYALISEAETGIKMACGDPKAAFRCVILDPLLTGSAPRDVIATAGMDALSHAIESYVCTRRNERSQQYAFDAFSLIDPALLRVLEDPDDRVARSAMLLGAFLAGAAIERSMLGAAHSCANPLTATHGIVHGAAVSLMMPAVMRFNSATVGHLYDRLQRCEPSGGASLVARVEERRRLAGLPETLGACGVKDPDLDSLAQQAAAQWTAAFNPVPVAEPEMRLFYEQVA